MMTFRNWIQKFLDFILEGMWTESLRLCLSYWRAWILGALLFSALGDLVYLIFRQGPLVFWVTFSVLVRPFELCFFSLCFLQQEPLSGKPLLHLWQFKAPLGYAGLCIVLYFAPSFLLLAIEKITGSHTVPTGASLLGQLLLITCAFLLIVRTVFAIPLSINGLKSPLATSWEITRGKTVRIAAHFIALSIMLSPLFLLYDKGWVLVDYILEIFGVLIYAAFFCAIGRILNGEYIAAHLDQDRRISSRET
jgi:hypothetical protein